MQIDQRISLASGASLGVGTGAKVPPRLRVGLVAFLFILPGCNLPEDDWGVVRFLWNEFPWWSVIWRLAFWTGLGTAIGLFVGILVSILIRRWGLYRLPWPRVRFWLTLTIVTLNVLAMPLFFGTIGFFEGLYRSGEVALRHSVIGKEWLPKLGEAGADAICFVDAFADKDDAIDWDAIQEKRAPVNVPRLLDRVDRIKGGVGEKVAAKVKENLFEENPEWKGEFAEMVIDWTLPTLIYYLCNHELQSRLGDYGVPNLLGDLRAEAKKDGDDWMTHHELRMYLSERVMIPLILYPLKQWVIGSQWSALGLAALWLATPPVLMFITRWIAFWWKRRKVRRLCGDKL